MPVRIALLGERSIIDGVSGSVRTRSSRTLALIAYLVMRAGMSLPRQQIASQFWPDSSESQASTNLRRELHTLRRLLGDEGGLVVTTGELRWEDAGGVSVDLRRFAIERDAALSASRAGDTATAVRHADAALEVYAGELLPGMYDEWLLEDRAALHQQCADLCTLICAGRAELGEPALALEAARRRIRLEPLEENGYRTLMELQSELGDRAGAVSTYHRCASVLESELGVTPGPQTRATLRRLLGEAPPARRSEPPAGRGMARTGVARVDLVGRNREFEVLTEVWRSASAGRANVAIVTGSPGVGKTRLAGDLASWAAAQGAVAASAQCFGASGRPALSPVADWLRSPELRSAAARLDPVWRDELERLMPVGPARPDAAGRVGGMVDAWQRHRFFEGLAHAVLATGRPALLVLDNLQWCDRESLAFITFLIRLAASAPLMIVMTLRSDALAGDPDLAEWVAQLRLAGILTEIGVAPLEFDGTARLAAAIGSRPLSPDEQVLLHAATGGFPLHIVEAMRAFAHRGEEPVPSGDLAGVLAGRMAALSTAAQEVAGLAAAVGRDFSLNLLAEASDLDADVVVRAVDELWRQRIVVERGDGYDFSHDLLRDAAYAQVTPARRWLLHRRLAQSLELLGGDDLVPVSAQLADQYQRAGRPEKALVFYQQAAGAAAELFAHSESITLLNQALAIVRAQPRTRDAQRQELAILEVLAAPLTARHGFASPELQTVLERSAELATTLARTESLVSALVGLWAAYFVQGRIVDSHRAAAQALSLLDDDSQLSGPAHFAYGGSSVSLGLITTSVEHLELAARLPHGPFLSIGTRPEVHGPAFLAHAQWLLGNDEVARATSLTAIDTARAIGHPFSLAVALAYAAISRQLSDDRPGLADATAELSELCARYDFAYYREWALVLRGWLKAGPEGIDLAGRGIRNLQRTGAVARMPYWLALLADLHVREGRREQARSLLDAAIASGQARGEAWWLPEVQRLRAQHDPPEQAAARLRAAAELASTHGSLALLRRCQADLAAAEAP